MAGGAVKGLMETGALQVYERLMPMDELTADGLFRGMLRGKPYLVTLVDGQVHVALDRCPHADFPLSAARREGDCVICSMHNGVFDLKTGQSVGTRKFNPLWQVASRVSDGYVEILIESATGEPERAIVAPAAGGCPQG
jgi:nitrite reductase/ring-hydroxylating ferredoxin subunit